MLICTLRFANCFQCQQILLLLDMCQRKFCCPFYICLEEAPVLRQFHSHNPSQGNIFAMNSVVQEDPILCLR